MEINKNLIYKIVYNIMTIQKVFGYRIRKRIILVRIPTIYNKSVMITKPFRLGMSTL